MLSFESIATACSKDVLIPQEKVRSDIQIIHADCRDALKKIKTNSVHLVLTDPPYFLDGLDSEWKKGKKPTRKTGGVIGGLPVGMKFDPAQGKNLQKFMCDIARQIKRVLVPGGFLLSFSQPRLSARMAVGIEDAGFEILDVYAWRFTQRAQMKAFSKDHFVDKMDIPYHEKNAN